MNKLFAMVLKYSMLPEKEFFKKATQQIYQLAERA
jgi:hypothetical protein